MKVMQKSNAPAHLIRALTSDHHVRFAAVDATPLWDGVRRGHPQLEAEACAHLTELLTATCLIQSRGSMAERVQLLLKGAGRAKALVTDAWPSGDIRGFLDLAPDRDAAPWITGPGLLQVMRSGPLKPYIGTLEMVEGSVQVQVEAYLLQSEQVQASCSLWCDSATGEAGGLLVEPMPDCPPSRMKRLVNAIEGLDVVPLWERDPDFLARWINQGEGADIHVSTDIHYRCRCAKESLLETLRTFPTAQLDDIFQAGDPVEIVCDYCGKRYVMTRAELSARSGGDHA